MTASGGTEVPPVPSEWLKSYALGPDDPVACRSV